MTVAFFAFLIAFYAGAVVMTAWSWQCARRGSVGFSSLRDLTGIGDRATLHRLFGLTTSDGRYSVRIDTVLAHRRRAGMLLSDLPVHVLLLASLIWASFYAGHPAAAAVGSLAATHTLILVVAAASILTGRPRALAG